MGRYLARRLVGLGARVTLVDSLGHSAADGVELLALDEAIASLAAKDERAARVVELRIFGGLTIEETAEAMKISPATVKRDWSMARAWLRSEISNE